jgi:NADH-quinone oxidoreductase subunit D
MLNNVGFALAVEKLLDIEVPERCQYYRVILGELARIADHFTSNGVAAMELGAFTPFLWLLKVREWIWDILERETGARMTHSFGRIGGMAAPPSATFKDDVRELLPHVEKVVNEAESLLLRNRIFMDRTRGIGILSKEDAIAWSIAGPLARASGVARDLRKDAPYLCYADNWDGQGAQAVRFQVPVADQGDVYTRFLVRVEEIKQSVKIIDQLIDTIPGGPIDVFSDSKMVKPPKGEVYGSIEATIQHFEIFMTNRGWDTPVGECYTAIESPNGELGYYIVADGGRCPWRVAVRPPSFINYQVFPKLIEGHQLADVVAVLGSINVIAAELDR